MTFINTWTKDQEIDAPFTWDSWNGNINKWQNMEYFQFSSVTQSCPTHCSPMDYSTPSFRVHHRLPEFTYTHVH